VDIAGCPTRDKNVDTAIKALDEFCITKRVIGECHCELAHDKAQWRFPRILQVKCDMIQVPIELHKIVKWSQDSASTALLKRCVALGEHIGSTIHRCLAEDNVVIALKKK